MCVDNGSEPEFEDNLKPMNSGIVIIAFKLQKLDAKSQNINRDFTVLFDS